MLPVSIKFAIFGNEYQARKSTSIHQVLAYLSERKAEVYVERSFYDFLKAAGILETEVAGVFD